MCTHLQFCSFGNASTFFVNAYIPYKFSFMSFKSLVLHSILCSLETTGVNYVVLHVILQLFWLRSWNFATKTNGALIIIL